MSPSCILSNEPLDPSKALADFTNMSEGQGAIASFTGIARQTSRSGHAVSGLFLDHHSQLTQESMQHIAETARQRFSVGPVLIIHRCGAVQPGDAIVLVAAASVHRRAALDAVDFMMDHLKAEALFWKREETETGQVWIEPTEDDYAALARWQ